MGERATIYRYGPIAWFWRAMIAGALAGGGVGLVLAARHDSPVLLFMAAAVLAPAVFFGIALAVRVDRLDDGRAEVWTLLFWRRRVSRGQLGVPRVREVYHGSSGPMYAPALWVPVRRRLPIYLDLLGEIPDRRAFLAVFPVPRAAFPRGQRPGR